MSIIEGYMVEEVPAVECQDSFTHAGSGLYVRE